MESPQRITLVSLIIIISISFGVVAFISCIVAEIHRNKKQDIRVDGSLCYLPGSPAFGFGLSALVCLCVSQMVCNSIFISKSCSKMKRDGDKVKKPAISKALFFISWISFGIGVILLSAATGINRKQGYGEGWLDGECYIVKKGVFLGAASLVLLTVSSAIGSAITMIRYKKQQTDQGGKIHTQLR